MSKIKTLHFQVSHFLVVENHTTEVFYDMPLMRKEKNVGPRKEYKIGNGDDMMAKEAIDSKTGCLFHADKTVYTCK